MRYRPGTGKINNYKNNTITVRAMILFWENINDAYMIYLPVYTGYTGAPPAKLGIVCKPPSARKPMLCFICYVESKDGAKLIP